MKFFWLSSIARFGIVLILLLSLAGYLGQWHFLLDLTVHFKVQYLFAALIGLGFFSLSRQTWGISLSLACILLNGSMIAPWYQADPLVASAYFPLRVLFANVNVENQNYEAAISLIRKEQPDVVALVETNDDWLQAMESMRDALPYAVQSFRAAGFGIALFSKFPLTGQQIRLSENPPEDAQDYHLVATMMHEGQPITVVVLHPPPPTSPRLFEKRNQELAAISAFIRTVTTPVVTIGDLNTTMWSPNYVPLVHQTGLKNARQGFGILPSWPAGYPIKIPIDHGLVSSAIQVAQMQTGQNIGSDHLPLIIDLRIGT